MKETAETSQRQASLGAPVGEKNIETCFQTPQAFFDCFVSLAALVARNPR